MKVYRITKKKYADELNGKRAALSGNNRWNSKGTEIIYTAESVALARAEMAGHVNLSLLPDPVLVEIELLTEDIAQPGPLPPDWNKTPPSSASKKIGDQFISDKDLMVLKVPSKYDPSQFNYLINPNHPDFEEKVVIKQITDLKS